MAFQDQVEDLTSLSVSDTGELSQFLKDGVIDVTNRWLLVRPQDISVFSRESAETTSNASLDINGAQIISVIRENGTNNQWRNCRQIFPAEQYDVTDTESLSYASAYNPAFMIGDNGQISVFPTPGATTDAFKAYYVNNAPVDKSGATLIHSHSDIGYFADDKVYLVIMYAGIRLLQATMGNSVISLTSVPPDVPSLSTISFSESNALSISATAPTAISLSTVSYSDATNADASATAIGAITVATVTEADSSSSAPAYTKPGHPTQSSFEDFFNLSEDGNPFGDNDPGAFSISVVPPDVPTITAASVSFSQAVPTYSKPTLSLTAAPAIGNLTISVSAPSTPSDPSISGGSVGAVTVASLPSAPDYVTPTQTISGVDWATEYLPSQVDLTTPLTALNNNVDLAKGVLDAAPVPPDSITDTIADFSLAGEFDDAMAKAKALIDTATIGGDTEPQSAQYWLNNEDPEMVAATIQVASQELQRANSGLQDALQTFNTDMQKFQASGIGKFNAEVTAYQAEVSEMSARAQGYIQTAQGYASEITSRLSITQTKVAEYQARVQDALNVFNEGNAVYQAGVQRNIQQAQIDMQDAQKEADLTLQAAIQDYSLELQLFQQEIVKYQAQVNDEVQEYQQNLAGDIQVWQAERQTDLQEYASNIQNELNEFNKENAAYQAQLQVSIKNAQSEDAEEANKIQKYSVEVQEYQAEVATEVQEYTQKFQRYQVEVSTAYQAWAKTESDNLQVFQLDIQNELNEFNKENARYQGNLQTMLAKHNSDLQKALTQAQLDAADAQQEAAQTTDIDKFNKAQDQVLALTNAAKQIEDVIADNNGKVAQFTAEAQHYATQVNEDVQAYTSQLQSDIQTMQATIANNQSLLTKYQAETVEYQAEVAAETQEQSVKMQQYQLLYAQLKAEYDQAFMIAAPQQPQQAEA